MPNGQSLFDTCRTQVSVSGPVTLQGLRVTGAMADPYDPLGPLLGTVTYALVEAQPKTRRSSAAPPTH